MIDELSGWYTVGEIDGAEEDSLLLPADLEISQNDLAVHYSEELAFVKQYIFTQSVEKTASFQYRMFIQ